MSDFLVVVAAGVWLFGASVWLCLMMMEAALRLGRPPEAKCISHDHDHDHGQCACGREHRIGDLGHGHLIECLCGLNWVVVEHMEHGGEMVPLTRRGEAG